MKFQILSVSKIKLPFVLDGEQHYLKRLKPHCKLRFEELGADFSSFSRKEALEKEAELISKRVNFDSQCLISLDERGKTLGSEEFAKWIEGKRAESDKEFCFVIGGAYGMAESLKSKSSLCLSLSKFTFPYQLSRLILVEQLYRAMCIIKGFPYHKA